MQSRRMGLALLLALALLPAASAGAATRAGASLENVSILVDGYEVFATLTGTDVAAPIAVHGTLLGADGLEQASASGTTNPDGSFALAFTTTGTGFKQPVVIRPGATVVLEVRKPSAPDAGNLPPTRFPVRAITAAADAAADRLTGTAPPGAAVTVTATGADGRFIPARRATAGSDGRWSVDFAGTVDLTPGAHGAALYFEGRTVYQRAWAIPRLALAVGATQLPLLAEPGAVAHAWLQSYGSPRAAGQAVAWNGATSLVLYDPAGQPAALLPGDQLIVRLNAGTTLSLTVPTVTVTVDPQTDTVSGTAEPGRTLRVTVDQLGKDATADADGAWKADFTGWSDLTTASEVALTFPGLPDLRMTAFAPDVTAADPLEAVVRGRGVAGTTVRAALEDAAGQETAQAEGQVDADGRWQLAMRATDGRLPGWSGQGELAVALAGDVRRLAAPLPLAVTADAARRVVAGKARPGSRVTVGIGGSGELAQAAVSQTLDAAADGRWEATFAPDSTLDAGTPVSLHVADPEGYGLDFGFPVFRAQAQVDTERVRVEGPPALAAGLELERDGKLVATARCTVARAACDARLADPAGRPVAQRAGDSLTVFASEGGTAALDLLTFVAHIDRGGADVVGEAPPNEPVRIVFGNDQGDSPPMGGRIGSDKAGVYDFEVNASQWSLLLPGLTADVFHPRAGGHELWARGVLEVARVTPNDAVVRGVAEPGRPVTAWLTAASPAAAGDALAAGSAAADPDGRYTLALADRQGRPRAPEPGEVVHLAHARGEQTVAVGPLTAWRSGASAAVAGITVPDVEVRAYYRLRAAAGAPAQAFVQGTADRYGTFALTAPAFGIGPVEAIEVAAYLPGGDELRAPVRSDATGGRAYLPRLSRP